ncbi:MAG TPA: hypothetical protein VKP69_08185, partial [Isosphaeraceae bacterium]|nr:hypothetical protein [Isosphaeraceae bacterium]
DHGYRFHRHDSNLTPGTGSTVRLHFAENWRNAAGRRDFNMPINGNNAHQPTVNDTAPIGPADTSGVLLDGNASPGSDDVRTINRRTLAGSSRALFNLIRYRSEA